MGNPKSRSAQEQRKSLKLSAAEQYELRIADLVERCEELERTLSRHQSEFDKMFRNSEAMRNRQVDIINRLLKGGTIDEEMTRLLQENAHLRVLRDDLEGQIADLEAQVATLKGDRQILSDMMSGKKGE